MIDIFMRSPVANSLAVIVLIALIFVWITSIFLFVRDIPIHAEDGWYTKLLVAVSLLGIPAIMNLIQTKGIALFFASITFIVFLLNIIIPILKTSKKYSHLINIDWLYWSILISTIGGLAVTGYITFIESTGAPIMCGPISGCSTVQNSRYATLFGFLPVGTLGLMGYIAILIGWLFLHFDSSRIKKVAVLGIWALSIFGVLFSIYLTSLEPFVIGATCMWCICSAVLMMILLLVSTPEAQKAFTTVDD